jgi:peroxin-3
MLTRIQLNLLGRRSYLSSVVSLATGGAQATISLENNDDDGAPSQEYGSDFDVNRKYLTFSWWLLNRGWVDVMQRVEAAVRQVFGHLSPRDTVSLETFSRLTSEVRRRVEGSSPASGGASTQWLPFLLPPASMEDFVLRESGILDDTGAAPYEATSVQPSPSSSASLRILLDETADLIESPAFGQVLAQLLDAAFAVLLTNKLAASAFEAPPSAKLRDPLSGAGYSRAILLPKILSVLTRQAHVIGNGMPNEYLQAMEAVRDLEGFAAVVYSSNWQAEIARDGEAQAAAKAHSVSVETMKAPVRETSALQQSQVSGTTAADGESSLVVVDPQASFDSAWEKAVAQQK